MNERQYAYNPAIAQPRDVSRVLRNTYALLAMTLAFSGLVAFVSQQMRLPYPNIFVVLIGFYGLFFLTVRTRDSGWGLVSTFALTGFMGYTLGPILNMYLGLPNGGSVIASAAGMTALAFFGLSAYALISRKDMSFLSGFLMAGFWILLGAVVLSFFVQISGLQLAISAGFVLFAARPAPSCTVVKTTTSWLPSPCTSRSTICSSACCRSSDSPATTIDHER